MRQCSSQAPLSMRFCVTEDSGELLRMARAGVSLTPTGVI